MQISALFYSSSKRMSNQNSNKKISPWAWVSTLYFAEGLPYAAVTLVSLVFYQQMGLTDAEITFYTSWFYLPWVIKPLWSPFLDLIRTKRWWVLSMEMLLGAAFAGVAFTINTSFWLQGTICFFWLLAFSSATHDVGADGFYMLGLDAHEQTFFVGIRSTFYRISMVVGKGGLVALAGLLQVYMKVQFSWALVFYGLAAIFICLSLYHKYILPKPAADAEYPTLSSTELLNEFVGTFASFFRKRQIIMAIAFMLLFRLPEALLNPVAPLFLRADVAKGGLGLSLEAFGVANGIVGVVGLLIGGILGGLMASKDGLKKWLWTMTFAITLPNIAYVYLGFVMPQSIFAVSAAIFIENFGYGFGFSAYMLFMLYFSQGEHKTSHYALCTGFMALSMMLPGFFAGALADAVGYNIFFVIVMASCLFPFIVASMLKIDPAFGKKGRI